MSFPSVIVLDGPVAAGKTAVGKLLAQRLGYRFLDTGSMYRAVTLLALQEEVEMEDGSLARLAQRAKIDVDVVGESTVIRMGGKDVTGALRAPEVEHAVSVVSRVPEVRHEMVRMQREIARGGRLVMAGRDIGTVVLPNAEVKIFLTASPEVRARRRFLELKEKGIEEPYERVLAEIIERDTRDTTRADSPLVPAADGRACHRPLPVGSAVRPNRSSRQS